MTSASAPAPGSFPQTRSRAAPSRSPTPGLFGAVFSTPIIVPPEAAILGVGRIAETPVARDGRILIRLMTHLCLSYDHRIIDGETAIKFLQHMRASLEAAKFEMP